jgi:hypothetical protein
VLTGDKDSMPLSKQALQQHHQQQDVQPATARRLVDINTSSSSSTGSDSSAACGGAVSSAAVAAAAAAGAPAAYRSPLQRNLVAIKLEEPPGTSECCCWCHGCLQDSGAIVCCSSV